MLIKHNKVLLAIINFYVNLNALTSFSNTVLI
jgi:hypothetical protein